MRLFAAALFIFVFLAGCSYHPQPITVYGRSGTRFTAPDLCAALTQCLNSTEAECYYNTTELITADQKTEIEACKAVKK